MRARLARSPVLFTAAVLAAACAAASIRHRGFLSWPVLVNLVGDNAFLGLAAIGETLVVLAGGIDLSVGAVVGLASVVTAKLLFLGVPAPLVFALVPALGLGFGAFQGAVVHVFRLPPFLVTLAGLFLARGLAFVVSLEAIAIDEPLYARIAELSLDVFPVSGLVFLAAVAAAAHLETTRFGVAVRAVGGGEAAARLLGARVGRTKIAVYALSGLSAALGGVVATIYTSSGGATIGTGLELDAIAAVVIGGTALAGGSGTVMGTFLGVLLLGVIPTAITFEGTLSSWWTRIVVGGLLLAFVLLQIGLRRATRESAASVEAAGAGSV